MEYFDAQVAAAKPGGTTPIELTLFRRAVHEPQPNEHAN